MTRNVSYAAALLALTLLIVLPVVNSVNATPDHAGGLNAVLLASGSPLPPPFPPAVNDATLEASGSPLPPPFPPLLQQPVLIASGSPLPPPFPPNTQSA